MKRFLLLLLLIMPLTTAAKVLIITYSCNQPVFIETQYKTFKKFLHDDYEFVIFNDARSAAMESRINAMCASCGLRVFRVPQEIHARPYLYRLPEDDFNAANVRHVNCIQYSLNVLGFEHDDVLLLIDSDMFLMRPFSITEYMQDKDIAAFMKRTAGWAVYLWPGLCFLNMGKLPDKKSLNFNCGRINNILADSGGWTHFYLMNHQNLRVSRISSLFSHQLFLGDTHFNRKADSFTSVPEAVRTTFYLDLGFTDNEIRFLLQQPDTFEFYLDLHFLHYRGGSTDVTQTEGYHAHKWRIFTEFINEAMQSWH